jgi:hypothetical protein
MNFFLDVISGGGQMPIGSTVSLSDAKLAKHKTGDGKEKLSIVGTYTVLNGENKGDSKEFNLPAGPWDRFEIDKEGQHVTNDAKFSASGMAGFFTQSLVKAGYDFSKLSDGAGIGEVLNGLVFVVGEAVLREAEGAFKESKSIIADKIVAHPWENKRTMDTKEKSKTKEKVKPEPEADTKTKAKAKPEAEDEEDFDIAKFTRKTLKAVIAANGATKATKLRAPITALLTEQAMQKHAAAVLMNVMDEDWQTKNLAKCGLAIDEAGVIDTDDE